MALTPEEKARIARLRAEAEAPDTEAYDELIGGLARDVLSAADAATFGTLPTIAGGINAAGNLLGGSGLEAAKEAYKQGRNYMAPISEASEQAPGIHDAVTALSLLLPVGAAAKGAALAGRGLLQAGRLGKAALAPYAKELAATMAKEGLKGAAAGGTIGAAGVPVTEEQIKENRLATVGELVDPALEGVKYGLVLGALAGGKGAKASILESESLARPKPRMKATEEITIDPETNEPFTPEMIRRKEITRETTKIPAIRRIIREGEVVNDNVELAKAAAKALREPKNRASINTVDQTDALMSLMPNEPPLTEQQRINDAQERARRETESGNKKVNDPDAKKVPVADNKPAKIIEENPKREDEGALEYFQRISKIIGDNIERSKKQKLSDIENAIKSMSDEMLTGSVRTPSTPVTENRVSLRLPQFEEPVDVPTEFTGMKMSGTGGKPPPTRATADVENEIKSLNRLRVAAMKNKDTAGIKAIDEQLRPLRELQLKLRPELETKREELAALEGNKNAAFTEEGFTAYKTDEQLNAEADAREEAAAAARKMRDKK